MKKNISAILLAGGTGSRFGSAVPKQFLFLADKRVIHYSLDLLLSCERIDEIIIVCDEKYIDFFSSYLNEKIRFAPPGSSRQESVLEGLKRVSVDTNYVCIHDGARPLLTLAELNAVIDEAMMYKAAALGVPAKNTIKKVDERGFVVETLARDSLWEMQTPQVLCINLYWQGVLEAQKKGVVATDDITLAELLGHPVKIVASSYKNIKITTAEDMTIASSFITHRLCPSIN